MNFNNYDEKITLSKGIYEDILSNSRIEGEIKLAPYGFKIMKRKTQI